MFSQHCVTFSGDTTREEGLPGLGLEQSWREALREKEGDGEAEPAEAALSSSRTVERLGTVTRASFLHLSQDLFIPSTTGAFP